MAGLTERVPEYDRAQDVANSVALAITAMVPIIGDVAASIAASGIQSHSERRNLELFRMLAEAIEDVRANVDGVSVENIVADDRFLAATERVFRAARGSADDVHRARLIRVLRHAGPWSHREPFETERMTDLLIRLGPVPLFLLRFFADPAAWLIANGGERWPNGQESISGGTLNHILGTYVFPANEVPPAEISRVIDELVREGLMPETRDRILSLQMTGPGLVEPRVTRFGKTFLAFAEGELDI